MQVNLGGIPILDVANDTNGCFGVGIISESPDHQRFAVIVDCFEGDNDAFLFNSDGTGKVKLTEKWDYLNGYGFQWAEDSGSFYYWRINSCCATVPADAPRAGWIRYDLAGARKAWVSDLPPVEVQNNAFKP